MVDFVEFPALRNASADGLLAMGGELSLNTLVSAYAQGIFPWYNQGQPVLWWSPDPRLVLYPKELKVSRSLRKTWRKGHYTICVNKNFAAVIEGCAWRGSKIHGAEQPETWITAEMQAAYNSLHLQGYAHSIECYAGEELVGGLYGIALDQVFFGESMFSRANDASKCALLALCHWLDYLDFRIIDCQVSNPHLLSLGAREISRHHFMQELQVPDINRPHPDFAEGFDEFCAQIAA